MILFTQKHTKKKHLNLTVVQYFEKYRSRVQRCTQGLASRDREEVGDGRAEGSSAIGDGGQAERSFMPEVDGTHVRIFESSQLKGSYVGNIL